MTRARILGVALSGMVAAAAMAAIGHAASLPVDSAALDSFAASQAAPTTTVSSDTTPPTVGATEFYDSDGNGKVDQIKLTYSEPLASTSATAPWSIAGGPTGLASTDLNLVSVSGSAVTLSFDETAGTATAVTTAAPTLTVSLDNTSGAIRDLATPPNAAASFSNRPTTDKAAPVLVTLEAFDDRAPGATNGKVDRVAATFSETLAGYAAGTSPWTLSNAPGGAGNTVGSVSVSGSVATLNLNEGVVNTSLGSGATAFKIDLAASATGIRDAGANLSTFTGATVADQAGPVFYAISDDDTGGADDGTLAVGDILRLHISESLDATASALPKTNVSVVLNDPSGAGNDETLTAANVFQPSTVSLNSDSFLNQTGPRTATFSGSTLRLQSGNTSIIELVLGSCTGQCGSNDLKSGTTTTTFTLISGFKDSAGVSVVGSVSVTGYAIF